MVPVTDRWRILWLLALAELLIMTLWFSATAVVPQLAIEFGLDDGQKSWLTMSVQIGFLSPSWERESDAPGINC